MTVEDVRTLLSGAGFGIIEQCRLPNDTGTKLSIENGAIVNVFDTGTVNVQGRSQEAVKAALGLGQSLATSNGTSNTAEPLRKVFVVYGHDTTARSHLEAMLRRWGLEPLILDQLPSEGQTIIEKLEKYAADVQFAVVLATPDDDGHRRGHEDEKAYRARQNVVLELGMLLAKLGRTRVAILLQQQDKMERPSDIHGLIYIPFKDDLQKDAGALLAKEMATQGYSISVAKL